MNSWEHAVLAVASLVCVLAMGEMLRRLRRALADARCALGHHRRFNERFLAERRQMRAELDACRTDICQVTAERDALRSKLDAVERLATEYAVTLSSTEALLDTSEAERDALRTENAGLRGQISRRDQPRAKGRFAGVGS